MNEGKWAFQFLGKSKYKLFISFFLCLVVDGIMVIEPQIVKSIVNDIMYPLYEDTSVTSAQIMEQLLPLILAALGLLILQTVARFTGNIFREQAAQRATFELRKALYTKLANQSRKFLMSNKTGDLINKCTGDVEAITHFLCYVDWAMFDSGVMLVAVLIVFFATSWKFTLIELCLAPFALLCAILMAKKVRPIFGKARKELSKLNTIVTENIDGNRVVRAFCREEFEIRKFDEANQRYYQMNLDANQAWVTYSPFMETVGNVMNATAIIVGALLVISGDITVGDLIVFTSLSWMLNEPMQQLGFLINDWQRFTVSCERVHELYDSQPEIVSPENAIDSGEIKGTIDFEHVSLQFDGNEVLKDINMHIPAGATVGIMGPTGSGKSSLFNLLSRFIDPTTGEVRIDGKKVQKYNLQYLRRNVAVALQDVFLFSDTVESNIVYGVPDAPQEVVYASAIDADADSFIQKLPDGYDTIVGERGMGLSGGQKQRLSLARALSMQAPILILDDTTSAVDMETEQYIQQHLAQREKKATTLIVAQRISSVKNADIIFILENGRITEQGTHKELLEKKGYYYNIWRIQQGYATEADIQEAIANLKINTAAFEGGEN
ncbi:MAG: ABC transporter ATP-binding protein [Lachnospiraceae bacterium]|nr:ABC transporter ATP-binding protein [Lachnospiraceae bacterium]